MYHMFDIFHLKGVFLMSIKVGINGFGRIGRMVVRRAIHHPEIEIVGINDLCPADYLAYMLKYDTMHGKFDGEVKAEDGAIVINGKRIPSQPALEGAGRRVRHRVHGSVPHQGEGAGSY